MTPAAQALYEDARQMLAAVEKDPQARYQLRADFYKSYGFGTGAGYGHSELSFLQWEIDRGVFNALDAAIPGSAWWRGMNNEFCQHAQVAALVEQAGIPPAQFHPCVQHWIAYFKEPCPRTWYRAHNSCIVDGYVQHAREAALESKAEQIFMGEVLYRLLYAQALVEDATVFHKLGAWLARPQSHSVCDLVSLPDFYPDHYPLTEHEIRSVLHKGHSLEEHCVDMMDRCLILPHLDMLFQEASQWLGEPLLKDFTRDGTFVYPAISSAKSAAR